MVKAQRSSLGVSAETEVLGRHTQRFSLRSIQSQGGAELSCRPVGDEVEEVRERGRGVRRGWAS